MFTDMLISEGTDPMGIRILKVGLIIQIAYILLLQVLGLRYVLLVRGWQIADSKKAGFVRLLWTLNTVTFLIMVSLLDR